MIQKAFAIGNSVAVTIPSKVGILPGTRLRHLSTRKNRIAYEILETPKPATRRKSDDYIKRVTGSIKLDMSTKEFMKIKAYCREHPYEKI